ncbi:alpha/beta hydrolase-fold protein [Lysobacter korlensis]|uniref:Alpha/beta hydrolase-fold protein n=1 Tax=Lysobacter korlensis TaxID=553636 RepID=A0ABV6RLI2_9GAMM
MQSYPTIARLIRGCAAIALAALLVACRAHGDPRTPIPTALFPAPSPPGTRLVVVLPGRADDLGDLRASGIVPAAQRAWPDADVVLAELTLDYYMAGRATSRLHEEVIEPARRRGYRSVWLVGASLGGMGSLLYDREHPGAVDGIVLLAPFLGQRAILDEIRRAGGVARWTPGPKQPVDERTWQRELWRHIQQLSQRPGEASRVWLAYGADDRFRKAMPLLADALPDRQVRVYDGGHTWRVWSPAAYDVLSAASATAATEGEKAPGHR